MKIADVLTDESSMERPRPTRQKGISQADERLTSEVKISFLHSHPSGECLTNPPLPFGAQQQMHPLQTMPIISISSF